MAKSRIVMLAPHEPLLDPRVYWEARTASKGYEVVVLGTEDFPGKYPRVQPYCGYTIYRAPADPALYRRTYPQMLVNIWRFCLTPGGKLATGLLAAVAFPFLAVIELLYALVIGPLRAALGRMVTTQLAGMAAGKLGALLPGRRRAPTDHPYLIRHVFNMTYALRRLFHEAGIDRPDIVHCNDLNSLMAGVLLKKQFGCALVYDAHELWPVSFPGCHPWVVAFLKFYEKGLLRHVDDAFTVSPQLAEVMRQWYEYPRVQCVPNAELLPEAPSAGGVEAQPPQPGGELLRQGDTIRALASGRLVFLYQGGYVPERGLEELLQAWRNVDGSKALLVLRGVYCPFQGMLEKMGQDQIDAGKILFLGPVTEPELVAASRQADVGVIPYRPVSLNNRYCCPNKLSQYMQAGLAILTNNLDYVKATVLGNGCGLAYDSDNPQTVVSAVERFTADRAFLAECKRKALETGRTTFHWDAVCGPLLDAYRRHAGGAGGVQ
jgi:glycosyltransferase involved in cell wall biosynthesis